MFTCCNSNVQLACTKVTKTWRCLISSNPRIICFYQHSNNQLIRPSWCFLVCRCRWGNKMFCTKCLDVSNVDRWFVEKVRSNPSTMHFVLQSFGGGRKRNVLHANTIWKGNKTPLVVDDTTIVICFLSSIPRILTCFLPLISQVLSPLVGTRWTFVLSLLLPMKREFVNFIRYGIWWHMSHSCSHQFVGILLTTLVPFQNNQFM